MGKAGLPFWLALFIGNVVSVVLLNWLVPWASRGFGWWLAPTRDAGRWTSLAGRGAEPTVLRRIALVVLAPLMKSARFPPFGLRRRTLIVSGTVHF